MRAIISYFDPHLLIRNIRFYILIFSILLSGLVFLIINASVPGPSLQTIRLEQTYAFLSLVYIYIALLASPLTQEFKFLPWRGHYLKARRAIGVSAFYFATLHTLIAFFGQLDGFSGIGFLDNTFLLALSLGVISLLILTLMALTSFDFAVEKLTFPKWKLLHRFVYLAAVAILIHSLVIGTHFSNLTDPIPLLTFSALAFLLVLESFRFDRYLKNKLPGLPELGISMAIFSLLLGVGLAYIFLPQSGGAATNAVGIHALHIKLAQQAQQGNAASNIPGLSGNRIFRYTVNLEHPQTLASNQDLQLTFRIFDASSGNPVTQYDMVYTKLMHLVIVDSSLKYFAHTHPSKNSDGSFSITTRFPDDGTYHLYINFQPTGAIEQQIGFTLKVGDAASAAIATQPIDTDLTKRFGSYLVSLFEPNSLNASDLSNGNQTLTFRIRDVNKQPVTNLNPYLGALGHLVLINEQTYDYIHVHPSTTVPDSPTYSGGPDVTFLPLGLYGPIKSGVYRVFAQFNPNGSLFIADFTIKIN